jgi:aerobic C4-dicarboxylate transport protein
LAEFRGRPQTVGNAFIELIKLVVAPLVFGSVGAGNLRKVGRVGLKALVYFAAMTTVALVLRLVLGDLFAPGYGMHIDLTALDAKSLAGYTECVGQITGTVDLLMRLAGTTFVDAFKGDILQVPILAILFGGGAALLGKRGQPLADGIERITEVPFEIVGFMTRLAPLDTPATAPQTA